MQRTFWAEYVRAYLIGGTEENLGGAEFVFTKAVVHDLRTVLSSEALATPVLFTERLSDAALAVCIGFRDGTQMIAVNARFKADPEVMAHTLVEEFVHAQQRLNGVDFDSQRRNYAYHERPYEQKAKRTASEILGYDPQGYDIYLQREQPSDTIFDTQAHAGEEPKTR